MKPTIGPWILTSTTDDELMINAINEHGSITKIIATLNDWMDGMDEDEAAANGALIAIAPDMFEALIAIQEAAQMNMLDAESINSLISDVLAKLANEAGVQ